MLGTGAAGLTAALAAHDGGASVAVFEKADEVGGTSAWSGGMVWIPLTDHEAELGIADSRDEVLTYLASLSHDMIDEKLAAAYVDAGPEVIRWLEANTPATFRIVRDFPDYHPEHPGGKPGGGRSLECPLFPFDELGPWAAKVTVGPQIGRNIAMSETSLGRGAPGGVPVEEMRAAQDPRRARRRPGPGRSPPEGLPRPGHRASDRRGGDRADRRGRPGGRCALRQPQRPASRCGRAVAWSWPPAASSGTASSYAASSAGR